MRFPSIPTLIRTLYTLNATSRATTSFASFNRIPQRATLLRSMPNIPFLASLFGSNTKTMADNTKYPVQKTEGEWQTQLNPGR